MYKRQAATHTPGRRRLDAVTARRRRRREGGRSAAVRRGIHARRCGRVEPGVAASTVSGTARRRLAVASRVFLEFVEQIGQLVEELVVVDVVVRRGAGELGRAVRRWVGEPGGTVGSPRCPGGVQLLGLAQVRRRRGRHLLGPRRRLCGPGSGVVVAVDGRAERQFDGALRPMQVRVDVDVDRDAVVSLRLTERGRVDLTPGGRRRRRRRLRLELTVGSPLELLLQTHNHIYTRQHHHHHHHHHHSDLR